MTQAETSSGISPGMPVEVSGIELQLAALWNASGASKARASLVNLVIYSEAPDAIEKNTPLLATLASGHAFRALLIQADPSAPETRVRAWITAHCHLRDAGKTKEICSEQITFRLDGRAAGRLANIVFSHLDSDLPLCFWWQGTLDREPDPQLWARVDRLIVDSCTWSHPAAQFNILSQIRQLSSGRCAICDLTWTRLFHLFYAIAQIFDWPDARERLPRLQHVTIRHAPGHRIAALELLGWLASRLDWNLDLEAGHPAFRRPDGRTATFETTEHAERSPCISSVDLHFDDATASVRRATHGDFYEASFTLRDGIRRSQMLPAGQEKASDILLFELSRSARHPLFWPSIRAIEPLLPGC